MPDPLVRAFDVIGQFSRDLEDLHHIVSKTFDLNDCPTQLPTQILYPQDFFPLDNQEQQEMVEHFVSILERFLNTKRTEFSIVESWSAFPPKTANKKPLNEFLKKVYHIRKPISYATDEIERVFGPVL